MDFLFFHQNYRLKGSFKKSWRKTKNQELNQQLQAVKVHIVYYSVYYGGTSIDNTHLLQQLWFKFKSNLNKRTRCGKCVTTSR